MNSSYSIRERLQMSVALLALAVCVLIVPHTVADGLFNRKGTTR